MTSTDARGVLVAALREAESNQPQLTIDLGKHAEHFFRAGIAYAESKLKKPLIVNPDGSIVALDYDHLRQVNAVLVEALNAAKIFMTIGLDAFAGDAKVNYEKHGGLPKNVIIAMIHKAMHQADSLQTRGGTKCVIGKNKTSGMPLPVRMRNNA